jgi:hypothetical protein
MYRRDNTMIPRSVQPRRTSGAFDWIASNASVDATGAPQSGGAISSSWGQTSATTVASGSVVTFQAVVINPTPMASTPTVGRLRIDEIRGRICVSNGDASPGQFYTAVAIYVSDINNTTTLWNVRNPLVLAESTRDDYLFLEGKTWTGNVADTSSAITATQKEDVCFELHLSQPVVIGGGQALHVAVACASNTKLEGGLNTLVTAYFRSRVGPVA